MESTLLAFVAYKAGSYNKKKKKRKKKTTFSYVRETVK